MAYKILGQSAPSATTVTELYTVPANAQTVASSLSVCNRSASSATFRVIISQAGAALDNKQYLYYDVAIDGNDTFVATIGITLDETDVLKVYASTGNLSFQLFGSEA